MRHKWDPETDDMFDYHVFYLITEGYYEISKYTPDQFALYADFMKKELGWKSGVNIRYDYEIYLP